MSAKLTELASPGRRLQESRGMIAVSLDEQGPPALVDMREMKQRYNPLSGKWLEGLIAFLAQKFKSLDDRMDRHTLAQTSRTDALAVMVTEVKKTLQDAASITALRVEVENLRKERTKVLADIASAHDRLNELRAISEKMDKAASHIMEAKKSFMGALPQVEEQPKSLTTLVEERSKAGPPAPAEQTPLQ